MKIYDISQEVLRATVFPGDPTPKINTICSVEQGDSYHLSTLFMCTHNGTHIDAPMHFIPGGKTVDQIPLEVFVGKCYLARHSGEITRADAAKIARQAKNAGADRRILIAGKATVTPQAASVFAQFGIQLLGCEGQSVGSEQSPMEVHQILLGEGIVLLEGVVLADLPEGVYFLSGAPINIAGAEGAPCRAYLIQGVEEEFK